MTWKDKPEVLEFLNSAKHHSATVEADIKDTFDDAETLEEFKESLENKMDNLIQEAGGIRSIAAGL